MRRLAHRAIFRLLNKKGEISQRRRDSLKRTDEERLRISRDAPPARTDANPSLCQLAGVKTHRAVVAPHFLYELSIGEEPKISGKLTCSVIVLGAGYRCLRLRRKIVSLSVATIARAIEGCLRRSNKLIIAGNTATCFAILCVFVARQVLSTTASNRNNSGVRGSCLPHVQPDF